MTSTIIVEDEGKSALLCLHRRNHVNSGEKFMKILIRCIF